MRKKSLNTLKDSIRAKTMRTRSESPERILANINRSQRGWFGYFKPATR